MMDRDELYRELNELRRDFGNRIGEILDKLSPPPASRGSDVAASQASKRRVAARPGAWTPEQDSMVRALWPDTDKSFADIAAALPPPARSVAAVQYRGYGTLGLGPRGQAPVDKESGAPGDAVAAPPRPVVSRDPSDGPRSSIPAVELTPRPKYIGDDPQFAKFINPGRGDTRPQPVTAHIPPATFDDNEPVSIQAVMTFLRRRDFTVQQVNAGQFVLDGRRKVNTDTLLEVANRHRETLKQPPFRLIGTP